MKRSMTAFLTGCVALLVLTGCAGTPTPAAVSGSTRIGVVDPQRVLTETEAGKKAREALNSFMKNRQALVELEEKELKRLEDDLIKQASVLSASAKREREEQFRQRALQFQQKVAELNREVQEKQKELLESFRSKVERVAGKVAQRQGMQMVVEKGRGGPTIYSDPTLDLTDKVIEEFNKGTAE